MESPRKPASAKKRWRKSPKVQHRRLTTEAESPPHTVHTSTAEKSTHKRTYSDMGSAGSSGLLLKSKRQRMSPAPDTGLQDTSGTDWTTLKGVYGSYYDKSGKQTKTPETEKVYKKLSLGGTEYAQQPASLDDLRKLRTIPHASVNSEKLVEADLRKQKKVRGKKLERPPDQSESELESQLKVGDYFYVRNKNYGGGDAERRVVVNVGTQSAALQAAHSVGSLFGDKDIAPLLKDLKIFLTQDQSKPVKHDKVVVYYSPDHTETGSEDTVGSRIVTQIESSIDDRDKVGTFAPLYSPVGGSTAWAEELRSILKSDPRIKSSFTETLADVIATVMSKNPKGMTFDSFLRELKESLKRRAIDPTAPHRHLSRESTSPFQ
jgi:hypothetical protein